MHLSHIPQYTILEQKYSHFCSDVLYCGIWDRCIMRLVYWTLRNKLKWNPNQNTIISFQEIGLMAKTKLTAWKLHSFVTHMLCTDSFCSTEYWSTPLSLLVNSGITDLSHGLGSLENHNIDGLVWDCSISNALAMEMLQSRIRPSIRLARGWVGDSGLHHMWDLCCCSVTIE